MIHEIMALFQIAILILSLLAAWIEAGNGRYDRMAFNLVGATLMFGLLIVGFV